MQEQVEVDQVEAVVPVDQMEMEVKAVLRTQMMMIIKTVQHQATECWCCLLCHPC